MPASILTRGGLVPLFLFALAALIGCGSPAPFLGMRYEVSSRVWLDSTHALVRFEVDSVFGPDDGVSSGYMVEAGSGVYVLRVDSAAPARRVNSLPWSDARFLSGDPARWEWFGPGRLLSPFDFAVYRPATDSSTSLQGLNAISSQCAEFARAAGAPGQAVTELEARSGVEAGSALFSCRVGGYPSDRRTRFYLRHADGNVETIPDDSAGRNRLAMVILDDAFWGVYLEPDSLHFRVEPMSPAPGDSAFRLTLLNRFYQQSETVRGFRSLAGSFLAYNSYLVRLYAGVDRTFDHRSSDWDPIPVANDSSTQTLAFYPPGGAKVVYHYKTFPPSP